MNNKINNRSLSLAEYLINKSDDAEQEYTYNIDNSIEPYMRALLQRLDPMYEMKTINSESIVVTTNIKEPIFETIIEDANAASIRLKNSEFNDNTPVLTEHIIMDDDTYPNLRKGTYYIEPMRKSL